MGQATRDRSLSEARIVALKRERLALLEEKKRRADRRRIGRYYPETGPLRRELYTKHMQFFAAGSSFRERLVMAANRVGKTEGIGAYEMTCHLTGEYPGWWEGKRFDHPIRAWAAGDTTQTTRDTVQLKLLGNLSAIGTGMLPGDAIVSWNRKAGSTPDCIETVTVKHKSGGFSTLTFKSYDQKRIAFQGTEMHVIWLDEEPPLDVYSECLLRTMATGFFEGGILMLTFTPLLGMSEVVMEFMPGGKMPEGGKPLESDSKFVVMATWDDAPHLSAEEKQELWKSIPPFQRDARSKGIPQLGSGAIYPIPEDDIKVDPFSLPSDWPRAYAMDVGWNNTAALWGAMDQENGVLYIYDVHKRAQAEPVIHAQAVKSRGDWIRGAVDPASRGRSQKDGTKLFDEYVDAGLLLEIAENGVESGLLRVWQMLSTGKIKVFSTCTAFFEEYRIYRRDEKGKVVKEHDHVMDCLRYLVATLDDILTPMPVQMFAERELAESYGSQGYGVTADDYDPLWSDEKDDSKWVL